VTLCHTEAEAREAVAAWVTEAGLTLHPDKTRVKSLTKLKDRLRAKTSRLDGRSLKVIVTDVNRTLRGW
jgi:RNA-directed DNA polymerase